MSATTVGVLGALCVIASAVAVIAIRRTFTKASVRRRLPSAARPMNVDQASLAAVGGVVVTALAFFVSGPVLASMLVIAFFVARSMIRSALVRRRSIDYSKKVPQVLDAMSRSIRSGSGLTQAMSEAAGSVEGEIGVDLKSVVRRIELGSRVSDALDGWTKSGDRGVALAVAAVHFTIESGAPAAQVFDEASATIRQWINAGEAARTSAAQARASAWTMTLLPVFITGLSVVGNPGIRSFVLHTTPGALLMFVGLGLDVAGLFVMQRMVYKVGLL